MVQSRQQNDYQYGQLQVPEARQVPAQRPVLQGVLSAMMTVLILSGSTLVAIRMCSSSYKASNKFEVVGEAQMGFVFHRGADCWQPCGEIGGHCPGFCGVGMACCRRGSKFDPPECRAVTNFWTDHHECVEPIRHAPVQHKSQSCLGPDRCGTSGDCLWCGVGNACCKYGAQNDPPECANVKEFPTEDHYTCVTPTTQVPLKHQRQNCWSFCHSKPGHCRWCGDGNLCCRYGARHDPPECRRVNFFPTKQFHTCVAGEQRLQISTTAQIFPPHGIPTTTGMTHTSRLRFTTQATSEKVSTVTPHPHLQMPSTPQTLSFYMYRAQNDQNYPFENIDAANIGGVLRYLHDEVVTTCPRQFQITRIIRIKVTMHTTKPLFEKHKWHFGPYVSFEAGKCVVPNCTQIWENYGYAVGCQRQGTSVAHYPDGVWYSIPGPCPSQDVRHKTSECKEREPGGQCAIPDGERNCTVHTEYAGEVDLDDLSGLQNFNTRCSDALAEYDPKSDTGYGTNFWNGKRDPASCAHRENVVLQFFKTKYPDFPSTLPDPVCDWWR
jgi:hypothetical protein